MDKIYYVVYWSPIQTGALYHKGAHPLSPSFLKDFQSKMAIKLSLANNLRIPPEAITITNVIELPADAAKQVEELKLIRPL
jgi:hypothetical protein